ncbi:MAG TPA: transcriptional regulator, partial [bacterium]|nr:transcriptional regulator [bacterium]
MPRNDQVTRQWYLIKRLEGGRSATLQDLVDAVPEDYPRHPRTIRRDLEALERHLPLVPERIDGQARWKFMEGYNRALGQGPDLSR